MRPVRHSTVQVLLGLAAFLGGPGSVPLKAQEPALQPELELLRAFLGAWTGEFQQSDERPQVLRTFTAILGGYAVRETRTVPEAGFEAETLFSYHQASGAVVFLGITNNGYRTEGRMTFDGAVFVQTGDQTAPDGSQGAIRVTFQLREDGSILNRLFNLEAGEWQPSHQILYVRRSPRAASRDAPSSGGRNLSR